MNKLPAHRQAIHGRTWGRQWRPEDYAAIERWPGPARWERAAGVVLAIVIGVLLAISLVSWWAS